MEEIMKKCEEDEQYRISYEYYHKQKKERENYVL